MRPSRSSICLDCFSRHVWARLYTSKMPVTAVQILNNHVLPFFEERGVKIRTILNIEHRTTRVGRPQSRFIERFHRTLLEEHLRIKGRTTWYETVEEMQKDLDVYLETYNQRRPHRGRGMEGRTPYDVFKAGIPRKRTPQALGQKGGEESSVGPDLREAGCQAIIVFVQPE